MFIGGGGTARFQYFDESRKPLDAAQRTDSECCPNELACLSWKAAMICTAVPLLLFVQAMHGRGIDSTVNALTRVDSARCCTACWIGYLDQRGRSDDVLKGPSSTCNAGDGVSACSFQKKQNNSE